jgi:hypothetical protein
MGPAISLAAVVIRACEHCHGKRELGKPCSTCGNTRPAVVKDLGVIARNTGSSFWERWKWDLWGCRAAQKRIRKTNEEQLRKNLGECG